MMRYNIDVVCLVTGEVLKEGVTLATAHELIQEKGWLHVETTRDETEESSIDDEVGCYTLWVKTGVAGKLQKEWQRIQDFWKY